MKLGRCIKELERIYGIKNGGNRGNQYKEADSNNYNLLTQYELAERIGISKFSHCLCCVLGSDSMVCK